MKITAKRILSVALAFAVAFSMIGSCLFNIAEASTTNLLQNGGFEDFSEGNFTNWTFWGGNNGNTLLEQVDGRTDKAAKITVDNNNNTVNIYQAITLDADKEYVLSAWVKTEDIALQWLGANGVYLSVSDGNGMASLTASDYIKEAADWQKLEITVSGSDYADKTDGIYFDLRGEFLTGTIYIDDVSLTVKEEENTNTSENLLENNGFEEFSNGAFANWTFWGGNNGNTLLEQVDGRTGKAAKITVDNNNNTVNIYQAITLDADKEYVLSAWVKTEDIALQWLGANGVYLSVSDGNGMASLTASDYIKEAADWQKLEITVSGSDYADKTDGIYFDLRGEFLTGTIYIDDVSLTEKAADDSDTSSGNTSSDTGSDSSSSEDTSSDTSSDSSSSDSSGSDSSSSEDGSSDSASSGSDSELIPDDNDALLKNVGFEEFSGDAFDYWYLWKGNHGNTDIAQVDGRTDKSAKITVNDNSSIVNLSQAVNLDGENKYTFSIWVKIDNIVRQWETAPGVYLTLRNDNTVVAQSTAVNVDSDWQKLEFTVDSSALSSGEKTFDLTIEYVKGDIYLDDACLKIAEDTGSDGDDIQGGEVVEDTAPLKNAGFESFAGGQFKYWTFWPGNKGNTTIEQVDGRTGKAAKINIDNNENIVRLYQEVEIDPAKEYKFSVWVKTEGTALQWPGAAGVYVNLACDNAKVLASESVNADSGWKKLEVKVNGAVLSGDEWSVCFDIAVEYMTGSIYIDDATLEETGKATPIAKPDEDELLKNNSFEIFSAGNFANWTAWKGNKGNTKFEQVKGRTGMAAKITVDDNNNIVNLYQGVTLDPTKEYTFSVWVKTEDIDLQWAGAQGVYLNFKYNNNVILMSKPVAVDSGWQKLELKVNGGILKGDEWGVSLDIAAEYLTGVVYVDDASVKATGKGSPVADEAEGELLQNSSFELFSGYNFARWSLNKGNNGNTQLTQVNGKTNKAAKIVVDDNNNIVSLYQGVTLDPTKEYTFSVWLKTEDIELQWAGAEGIYLALGYNNTTPVRSKAIKEDSDWTKLEVTVGGGDIPADAWGIQFAIMSEFLTGTIYVDDASMMITGEYVPKPDSYLVNGSFDLLDEDNQIANWSPYVEDVFSVIERNTSKTKDSIASASIMNADDEAVSYWEQQLEGLDTSKAYLLSGYIFSDMIVGDDGGAAVFVEFYDPDGNLIRTFRTDYVKGEQTDWTEFQMKLVFPENCNKMVVKAALVKAVGTAYFDEFSLVDFDDTVHTAEEGTFENLYFMGVAAEPDSVGGADDGETDGIPVFVWIIAGAVVVLAAAGTVLFVLLRKKKAIVKI